MAQTYTARPIQMSDALIKNLKRIKDKGDVHVWANKVYTKKDIFATLSIRNVKGMELAGYLEEYKSHWYRLTAKGLNLIEEHKKAKDGKQQNENSGQYQY